MAWRDARTHGHMARGAASVLSAHRGEVALRPADAEDKEESSAAQLHLDPVSPLAHTRLSRHVSEALRCPERLRLERAHASRLGELPLMKHIELLGRLQLRRVHRSHVRLGGYLELAPLPRARLSHVVLHRRDERGDFVLARLSKVRLDALHLRLARIAHEAHLRLASLAKRLPHNLHLRLACLANRGHLCARMQRRTAATRHLKLLAHCAA
jgi:hypothetical protein